jgi:prepilin-type N-terminal cleavage/methylation domain-containing protein
MGRQRGFTIIEVVIAMAIVGILVIVATSNLNLWSAHYSAVDFQREFLSQFSTARTRSQASNLRHRILIDMTAERATLQRQDAGTSTWVDVGQTITAERGAGVNDIAVDNAAVAGSTYAIVVNPGGQASGQANPASDLTIAPFTQADVHLAAGSAADRSTIRVFGWTSRARLTNGW